MGILNVTPDSFSDGGRFLDPRRAAAHALRMQEEGADLIDIGGESTRPGAAPVSLQGELRRVLPVVERLRGRLQVPISIDTSKPAVAEAAAQAGARVINDVTGLRDPRMAAVAARNGVSVILMHMPGTPRTMQRWTPQGELIPAVCRALRESIRRARAAGIPRERILIDPGIGFGKGPLDNLRLIAGLAAFKALGYPVVVGPSRKSFIGWVLGVDTPDRLHGTAAAVALAVANGADVVRVHDVAAMRQVALLAHAIRSC